VTEMVYKTATSVDGYIADASHSLAWLFEVDRSEGAPDHEAFMQSVGAVVEGSTTYEWVLRETDLLTNPARWHDFYGQRPTFVFTSRQLPVQVGADVRFVCGSVLEALPALRAAAKGRDVWVVGGGDLAGQFADAGALDKVILTIAPATLAGGAPLFPRRLGADRLALLKAERIGQFVELTYALSRAT
jgi:dihydrofolate reductase